MELKNLSLVCIRRTPNGNVTKGKIYHSIASSDTHAVIIDDTLETRVVRKDFWYITLEEFREEQLEKIFNETI